MIVKICGLRQPDHALAAVDAGADWLGLVFAPSRRRVTAVEAAAIAAAVRSHQRGAVVRLVGLFVNEKLATIQQMVLAGDLDYVQLSGDEAPDMAQQLARPLIKSLRLTGDAFEAAWLAHADMAIANKACFRVLPLIDAHVPGTYGGTGRRANWQAAAALARQRPLLLAGGLDAENVAAAIAQVRPWGVDVSSGVETDGVKDPARIAAFVQAVRHAKS